MFLDGGMLTGSAFMSSPWGISRIYGIDDPAYRGMRYIPDDFLIPAVRECAKRNLAFTAHSVGDAAVAALLEAYAVGQQRDPDRADTLDTDALELHECRLGPQCAELGIGVDIQPAWLYLDSHTLVAQFGEERLRYFQPLASLSPPRWRPAVAAITCKEDRLAAESELLQPVPGDADSHHPHRSVPADAAAPGRGPDPEQVLRFYTINNAWLMRSEKELGSLEVGKLADFVRLDRDLLTCPVEQIRETRVFGTWLSGKQVYSPQ